MKPLGFFVPARDQRPQTPFGEGVDLKRGGRHQEVGLNLSRQLKKVHDLGDTSPRDAFTGRDPGLGELGIVVELLALTVPTGKDARAVRFRSAFTQGSAISPPR